MVDDWLDTPEGRECFARAAQRLAQFEHHYMPAAVAGAVLRAANVRPNVVTGEDVERGALALIQGGGEYTDSEARGLAESVLRAALGADDA